MDIVNDLRSREYLEQRPNRQKFRVMEVVDIGSLAQGEMESAPTKAKHPSETIPGLRQSHNLYPIHHFVSIMLGDQNHFVTRSCQRLGLLVEDAIVKGLMYRTQNANFAEHFHSCPQSL
jgi:hypothetical protein